MGSAVAADRSVAAIASVNGASISRESFVQLLLKSHGVGILEQWIGLEAVRQYAESRGIVVTERDVRGERERALRKLSSTGTGSGTPLATSSTNAARSDSGPANSNSADSDSAERSLEAAMAARNVSPEELDLILRRNACLRKCVEADLAVSEMELHEEMDRVYGQRVEVRHIQLATPGEVDRVLERWVAGAAFEDLARTHSANEASAARGGLLEPFSRGSEEVPPLLRQTAFAMEPGAVSPAIRVGPWYHLLRLERRIPAESRDLGSVRAELERQVRERRTEAGMFALYEKLFRAATIEIPDADLRAAFSKRHPDRETKK